MNKPIPQGLLDCQILKEDGSEISLSTVLNGQPTLIMFVRHFGCIGCTLQMNTISPRIKEITALGVKVIVIGNGEPHYIEEFKIRNVLRNKPVEVYTDPSLFIYKNAQLKRNLLLALGPTMWYELIVAWSKGVGQKSIEGDNGQMGGTLLVGDDGNVEFYYRNKTVANHSDPNKILDQIYKYIGRKGKAAI